MATAVESEDDNLRFHATKLLDMEVKLKKDVPNFPSL